MLRAYRKGELPDIEIPHSDILKPLIALHSDPIIAKELLLMVFKVWER